MTRPEHVPADQGRNRRRRAEVPSVRDEPVVGLWYISSQIDGLGFYHENLRGHQMHIDDQIYRLTHYHLQQSQAQPPMTFLPTYPSYPDWQARRDQVFQQYYPGAGGYGFGPSGTAQQAAAVEEKEDGDDYEEEEEAEEETETEEDDDEEED